MAVMGRFEPFNWRDFDPGEHPQLAEGVKELPLK
jgi:hypothetical protein